MYVALVVSALVVNEPLVPLCPEESEHEDAFVEVHEITDVPPVVTLCGLAPIETTGVGDGIGVGVGDGAGEGVGVGVGVGDGVGVGVGVGTGVPPV